ncbi:hypothetical protein Q4603_05840 [Zobellia galactanivorans]|uniref:hypothetical protein n=1 Tax=Zobellia galactanivorans (strain DSM 12802 / CCUG 47099 / CIP 106680 / NCIMB 13871 / Dsij) TaxID=63186 RepID=UPI0026E228C2|nr:hypothetical protein [Zobellia galactanivorans]MDO6808117.1 hypothetical protein [Zobellia galactanivorans]
MRKQEQIRKALGLTSTAYQNCKDTHFTMWCNRYAQLYAMPLLKMIGNDHLQNWYDDQWKHKVELPFYMDHEDYIDAGIEDIDNMQDLFLEYPENIMAVWPQTLLENITASLK